MRKLDKLKRQAERRAKSRGHLLGPWKQNLIYPTAKRAVELANCINCGEWVQVDTCPPPNGIDVGGPAIAVECNYKSAIEIIQVMI